MIGMREHINRLQTADAVAVTDKIIKIARQGLGIAGYVNYFFGGEGYCGAHKTAVASRTRRIHYNHIGAMPLGCHIH